MLMRARIHKYVDTFTHALISRYTVREKITD
jgi:hypothetical protein